ncbi:MAG: hypothetical protein ABIO39_08040 [Caulobacteraceae bacterium]
MSVRSLFPKPRLAALMRKPGGVPAVEALAAAGQNLQELRGECLADLEEVLAKIEAMFAAFPSTFDDRAATELYDLCRSSLGVAGAVGMDAIDTALSSLCTLLDNLKIRRIANVEAVGVHVRSLRVLVRSADVATPAEMDAILSGLRMVSERYDPQTAR